MRDATGVRSESFARGALRDDRVQGDGVGDDGADVVDEPGERGHREARRSLAVHERLDALRAGPLADLAHRGGVVEHRRLVEGVAQRREVDRRAPVLHPHVVALAHERVDHRQRLRRAGEDRAAHPGARDDQDRAAGRLGVAAEVAELERQAVAGAERPPSRRARRARAAARTTPAPRRRRASGRRRRPGCSPRGRCRCPTASRRRPGRSAAGRPRRPSSRP